MEQTNNLTSSHVFGKHYTFSHSTSTACKASKELQVCDILTFNRSNILSLKNLHN